MFNYITFILLNPTNLIFEKDLKVLLLFLNSIYLVFSVFFVTDIFFELNQTGDLKFSVGCVLVFIQLVIPQILQLFFVLHFIRDKKMQLLMKIDKVLIENQRGLMWHKIKFICHISIIIGVQLAKLLFAEKFFNIAYAFSVLIPDAVRCASDLIFVYYVDILTSLINSSVDDIKFLLLTPTTLREHRNKITEYSEICFMLTKFYSMKLLLNITFNFILLITSCYWIFVRLAFNHLKNFETFLYLVQPLLCMITVFHSSHKCFMTVSF